MTILVHHLENSRSQRVLWLLEELKLPYEVVRYERNTKTMLAPPELRKVHPLGKSPVIQDGPVTGEVTGHRLHLRFRLKSGLRAEQWLELQAGGRTALNRMVVTKWGVPVARLTETITRE